MAKASKTILWMVNRKPRGGQKQCSSEFKTFTATGSSIPCTRHPWSKQHPDSPAEQLLLVSNWSYQELLLNAEIHHKLLALDVFPITLSWPLRHSSKKLKTYACSKRNEKMIDWRHKNSWNSCRDFTQSFEINVVENRNREPFSPPRSFLSNPVLRLSRKSRKPALKTWDATNQFLEQHWYKYSTEIYKIHYQKT